jgi:hypothetical protein
VLTATATAALSALVVGLVNIGIDEIKAALAARRKASEEAGKGSEL